MSYWHPYKSLIKRFRICKKLGVQSILCMWYLVFASRHRLISQQQYKNPKGYLMVMADPTDLGHGKKKSFLLVNTVRVRVGKVQFSEIGFQIMLESLPSLLYHTKQYIVSNFNQFNPALLKKIRKSQTNAVFSDMFIQFMMELHPSFPCHTKKVVWEHFG